MINTGFMKTKILNIALVAHDYKKKDLLEWSPSENLPAYIQKVLSQEKPIEEFLSPNLKIRITDDQPYNEYYLLRRLGLLAY